MGVNIAVLLILNLQNQRSIERQRIAALDHEQQSLAVYGGRGRRKICKRRRTSGGSRDANRPREFESMRVQLTKRWFGFEGVEAIEKEEKFRTQFRISYDQYHELERDLLELDYNRDGCEDVKTHWITKTNRNKTPTLATLVKILFCLDTLVSGTTPDRLAITYAIGASTGRELFIAFTDDVCEIYKARHLRQVVDQPPLMQRIIEANKHEPFDNSKRPDLPGLAFSVDCTHIVLYAARHCLKNATVTGHGNSSGQPSLSFEASCDANLYFTTISSVHGGVTPDTTIFKSSPILNALVEDRMPELPHDLNGGNAARVRGGTSYCLPYFFGDTVYWGSGKGGYGGTIMCAIIMFSLSLGR